MTSSSSVREYPRLPLVGVGAVTIRDSSILLVKRNNEPSRGLWSIPGGLVELGEDLKVALRREVLEECSVEIEPLELVDVVNAVSRDQDDKVRFHYVIVDFFSEWRRGEPVAGDDVEKAEWISLDVLDAIEITKSARTVIRKVARGR